MGMQMYALVSSGKYIIAVMNYIFKNICLEILISYWPCFHLYNARNKHGNRPIRKTYQIKPALLNKSAKGAG